MSAGQSPLRRWQEANASIVVPGLTTLPGAPRWWPPSVASERLTLSLMIASAAFLLAACSAIAFSQLKQCGAHLICHQAKSRCGRLVSCSHQCIFPFLARERSGLQIHVLHADVLRATAIRTALRREQPQGFNLEIGNDVHLLREVLELLGLRRQRLSHHFAGRLGADAGINAWHAGGGGRRERVRGLICLRQGRRALRTVAGIDCSSRRPTQETPWR